MFMFFICSLCALEKSLSQYNYLRRHVSLCANSIIELNVDGICDYVVPGGQSEVAYGAGTISLHEDIF